MHDNHYDLTAAKKALLAATGRPVVGLPEMGPSVVLWRSLLHRASAGTSLARRRLIEYIYTVRALSMLHTVQHLVDEHGESQLLARATTQFGPLTEEEELRMLCHEISWIYAHHISDKLPSVPGLLAKHGEQHRLHAARELLQHAAKEHRRPTPQEWLDSWDQQSGRPRLFILPAAAPSAATAVKQAAEAETAEQEWRHVLDRGLFRMRKLMRAEAPRWREWERQRASGAALPPSVGERFAFALPTLPAAVHLRVRSVYHGREKSAGYALLRPQLLPDGGLLAADEAWQRELQVELQTEATQGAVAQTGRIHCHLSWDPQPLDPPVRSNIVSGILGCLVHVRVRVSQCNYKCARLCDAAQAPASCVHTRCQPASTRQRCGRE